MTVPERCGSYVLFVLDLDYFLNEMQADENSKHVITSIIAANVIWKHAKT